MRNTFVKVREMAFKGLSVVGVNCGADTMVHEIGHNLGTGHGTIQNSDGYPISSNRGYGVQNQFATILTYPDAYGLSSRLQYFSNPNVYECESRACGTVLDNAASGMYEIVEDYVEKYSSCYPMEYNTSSPNQSTCGNNVCLEYLRGRCKE